MLRPNLKLFLPATLTAAAVISLFLLIYNFFTFNVGQRLPGADNRPYSAISDGGPKEGSLQTFHGKPSGIKGSWPCFRGPDRDAIGKKSIPLLRQFSSGGPKTLWQIPLAEGYAGAAVWNGRVYIIDYDTAIQADAIRCLSLDEGKEIWRYSYPVKIPRNQGITRTVPAVADGYVVTMGPRCHVACLNAQTGQFIWGMDLIKEYGAQEPPWYAGQCPRIENGRVIIAPGGKVLMVAVECATGKVVWKTDNPEEWRMTHSSLLPVTFAGKRMFVYCASGGVAGVDADNGKVLWKTDAWKSRIIVPSPVDMGNGRIFFCAGYKIGSMILQLKQGKGEIVPEVWSTLKAKVFGSNLQTPIFYRGNLYGVAIDDELTCLDTNGEVLWKSGSANTFGLGSFIIADEKIIILNDDGVLSFIEAKPDSFSMIANCRVLEGRECWGPPAIINGRLIIRDLTAMKCLDVSQ